MGARQIPGQKQCEERFMRRIKRALALLLFCIAVAAGAQGAEVTPYNPILFPQDGVEYVSYPDSILNVLLMGIDFGTDGYWGSGYKSEIQNCHTDAVMVIAINLTRDRVDIVSLPRDSVTVVPGVRGVYKLNGAVNCGATLYEGLGRTKAAVERLLGGIKIDCWFAVDMNAMFRLGDAIGGVDFYVDMNYVGSSGTTYAVGMQHLNGTGIMDYVRARKNATVDDNDLGRARRQRDMMTAVFNQLLVGSASADDLLGLLADPDLGFFTNMTNAQAVGFALLAPTLLNMDMDSFTSYSLDGKYRTAMGYNFTFTDQEHRAEVIKTVYGIDVPELPYVSYQHTQFLMDTGFASIHAIMAAKEFMDEVSAMKLRFDDEQQAAWDDLTAAYWNAVDTFQNAADTLDLVYTDRMKATRDTLRKAGNDFAALIGYEGEIAWRQSVDEWYNDPYVNEYQLDWR
jgi:LCP family protein required for cell wall assembly